MVANKMLRVDEDTWKEFQKIASKEGRFLGKMLDILVKTYEAKQEASDGQGKDS
jgi:hypothetical protein